MTERLHFPFSLSCIGEGNGNPPQCFCLENPKHGGVWWAVVYGVAQSRTRLKWLSSSSSKSEVRHAALRQREQEVRMCWVRERDGKWLKTSMTSDAKCRGGWKWGWCGRGTWDGSLSRPLRPGDSFHWRVCTFHWLYDCINSFQRIGILNSFMFIYRKWMCDRDYWRSKKSVFMKQQSQLNAFCPQESQMSFR